MLKPGGYLLIDHRNYDYILDTGNSPAKNIYYTSKYIKDVTTSILYVKNKPNMVTLDYIMDTSSIESKFDASTDTEFTKKGRYSEDLSDHFRLSYYPHRLNDFTQLLQEVFHSSYHKIFGDFKPLEVKDQEPPAFYIHFIKKEA